MSAPLKKQIKAGTSEVFRRASIKRRNSTNGQFESDWFDITSDIKSFGKVTSQVDSQRPYKFTFGNVKILVDNSNGNFNPHDNEFSYWNGYLNQQRTLLKLEAGFKVRSQNSNGRWINKELPSETLFDVDCWDEPTSLFDQTGDPTIFIGIISGDILLSDKNDVSLNAKPLTSVFQDYPARLLTGWTSTGMTASQFMTMLRDQTDGSGSYIFRPFFGDTTSNWDISTTTNVYSNLNTSTAQGVFDKTVWDVIEKLAESENYIPRITRDGIFKFSSRDPNTTTAAFEFYGGSSFNSEYGQTIKRITSFGRKISKYYSRVEVKYREEDTTTSYEVVGASFSVSPSSSPWVLGHRTLKVENLLIPTSTVAATIANTIFNEVSTLKNEVDFTTSFVPQLDLFDRFTISYDTSDVNYDALWDFKSWAHDSTDTSDDLYFDKARGDAIALDGQEFKFLSFEIDLDKLENKFLAREV